MLGILLVSFWRYWKRFKRIVLRIVSQNLASFCQIKPFKSIVRNTMRNKTLLNIRLNCAIDQMHRIFMVKPRAKITFGF